MLCQSLLYSKVTQLYTFFFYIQTKLFYFFYFLPPVHKIWDFLLWT